MCAQEKREINSAQEREEIEREREKERRSESGRAGGRESGFEQKRGGAREG